MPLRRAALLLLALPMIVAPPTTAQAEPAGSRGHDAGSDPRPNVLFVITDDQGYGDLGCTGNPVVNTPNLDAFHDRSVRLTNFHVGPTCAPTRAGLMTGHYAGSTGVWHTVGGRSLIREREWLLPQALAGSGYRTAMFGKWHLGDSFPYRPQDRGFETVIGHAGGGIGQQPDAWGNDYFDDTYLVNGVPTAFEGYCTDVWFDQAESFIRDHTATTPEQPFFCYLALNAPHSPYNVPAAYFAKYRGAEVNGKAIPDHAARFYGMIDHLDERFGGLDQTLHELGVAENTVLVFMTDNGSSVAMTDKQGFPKEGFNAGLRGGKGSPYEGGHKVPVFWRWPAGGLGGSTDTAHCVDVLTANIDFMPTLMDLCDVPRRLEYGFHGKSIAPLLYDEDGHRAADWPARSVVTESQRVLQPIKWRKSCVMTDRWRLIAGTELYDVRADPGQRHDVAADHPDVVAELRSDYEAWYHLVYHDHALPVPLVIEPRPGGEPVQLNGHDWRYPESQVGEVPWHQGHIREGVVMTGFWEVDVRQAGRYRIELRRWPRDAGHGLSAGIDGDDVAWNRAEHDPWYGKWYTGGKALDLKRARLSIGHQRLDADVEADADAHVFTVDLPPGPGHLRAEFEDADGVARGAYYVYVTPAP